MRNRSAGVTAYFGTPNDEHAIYRSLDQPKGARGRSPDKTYSAGAASPSGELGGAAPSGGAGAKPRPGEAGASPDFQGAIYKTGMRPFDFSNVGANGCSLGLLWRVHTVHHHAPVMMDADPWLK